MNRKIGITALAVFLSISIGACGSDSKQSAKTNNTAPANQTNKEKGTEQLSLSKEALTTLKSYNMKINYSWSIDNTSKFEMANEIKYSKDNNARQIKFSTTGIASTFEIITIGDTAYTNMQGKWIKTKNNEKQNSSEDYAKITDAISKNSSDYSYKGKEKISDIDCKKYSINGDYEYPLPNFSTNGKSSGTSMHKSKLDGTVWISTDKDSKDLIVKEDMSIEGIFDISSDKSKNSVIPEGKNTVLKILYNITDLNTPVTIEAPKDATSMDDLGASSKDLQNLINQMTKQ
jgi:hypothetical protein